MLFFSFSFFLSYNLMYSAGDSYVYHPITFIFVGVVTLFLTWSEIPKLEFQINRLKRLLAFLLAYISNLLIVLFVTNFGFAFYRQINFQSTGFFSLFYSLVVSIFHLVLGPFLIGVVQLKVVQFILNFLEELIVQDISKLSCQIFEEAKKQFAPQLSFRSTLKPLEVFEPNQMYFYGAHHFFYKTPKRALKVSREKKIYHYEQLVKKMTTVYDPFSNSDCNIFTISSNERLDFYFKQLMEEYHVQIPDGKTIHPEVRAELEVIEKKQNEFINYIQSRYVELKNIQSHLLLDFSANETLNRVLKNIDGFKNLGDRFLKDISLNQQSKDYPFKLLLTTKGIYLAHLVNLSPCDKYQLMVDETGQLNRISLHNDWEEIIPMQELVDGLIHRSEQLYYQLGLQADVLAQKKIKIQPILLLNEGSQMVGELSEVQTLTIKAFRQEIESLNECLTLTELKDLEEVINQVSETDFLEEVFDYEQELTHNIQVFIRYMSQIKDLIAGFEKLRCEVESNYRNKN